MDERCTSKADRPEAEKPAIDREQIAGLLAAAGTSGAREIISAFWKSTDGLLETLKLQLAAGRLDEAARTAHALKGSALNVGALRISSAARGVEEACRAVDVCAAKRKVGDAEAAYQETAREMDSLIPPVSQQQIPPAARGR